MPDKHTPEQRSYNMSRIKGKETKPEIILRKALFAKGFRYSLHSKKLPGKPDIVLRKYKTVIFVNGCFWHGHEGCRYFVIPKTRTDFWMKKITGTIGRDLKKNNELDDLGWKILTVWECELKKDKLEEIVENLILKIRGKKTE